MSISTGKRQFDLTSYEKVRLLGRGAFSDVFLYQLKAGNGEGPLKVAIKMPREDHGIQDKKRDGDYLQGEAEVIRKLAADETGRDLVVTLYYEGPHPLSGEPCLALEAFSSEDGWRRLDEVTPELSLEEALRVLGKIIQLLSVQQKKGIINPDLKLDSFFVQREPYLIVKATDFNTTTVGPADSPEWQKVRRGMAEVISYVLSQGRSRLFLAFTHDQQPADREIEAEESRLVPPVARGLITAALYETDFDDLDGCLQAIYQDYQAQSEGIVDQVLAALERGNRERAQGLLWDKILKESLPISGVDKAKEQMAQGNVQPTLALSPHLPPELKGVPWLTVWAHLAAPPMSLIAERTKAEPDYFLPLYRHLLNNLKASRMADALCSLLLIAPLPYDGSFASWIKERGQKDGGQCCPICEEIAGVREELLSKKENVDKLYNQVSLGLKGLDGINAELKKWQQKTLSRYQDDERECKLNLKEAIEAIRKAQESPGEAATALAVASLHLDDIWNLVSEDNQAKIDGLRDQLDGVSKLMREADEQQKQTSGLQSRQRELISQLQKEERQ